VTDTTNVVAALSAGTGISLSAGGEIANTSPDQTVALTGAGTTTITGTYPNFTITSTGGSGGNETLAQTLALGNTTGGTDLSVSSGDNIVMAASSTVDGRDVSVDGTKLDGIEAGANVTDTANVTAAGALMDSEVTNLAQVKAFDSADYATAAQGATANAALPKAGGAMTGAITTNSTFDGRDVATDGTKLDGIEASADVTDTTNVVAALTAGSNITIAADGTIASTASGGGETLQQTLAIGNTTTTDTKIQFRDTGLYINSSADGQLDIVADTEVQIAATTVDVNGILDVSGNIVAGGTVDGRDVATDGTKLDGIEASADVTDTANVTAAGAVMDSELTSEASVKALNQGVATTDSPAFAGLTVDTTTLAVDSTNNRVGVGIASPTELLHVSGATDPKILVKATGAGDADADIILDANDTGESGVIFNNSGVKKARIDWSNQNLQLNMATESGTNGTIDFQPNDVLAMRITAAGVAEFKAGITEDSVTLSGTSTTIDLATATNFVHDLTGNTTYTFSNPATTGNASAFTLKIIQGSTARAITWPSSVDWAGGTAPTLTATNNGVDIFTFFTLDGGTTYYGFTAGQAMA
jgi:hypothetical protein